ncbi:MAG: hypothetical protein ACI4XW_10100 [Candidatus Spyradocola sp.]
MLMETTVLGHPLRAQITPLDDGLHVLLTGGCRTHVGAVTLAEPGRPPRTLLRQAHRDDVLSTRWASALADALHTPICAACGIHYDNATLAQIRTITTAADALLQQAIARLKNESPQP